MGYDSQSLLTLSYDTVLMFVTLNSPSMLIGFLTERTQD